MDDGLLTTTDSLIFIQAVLLPIITILGAIMVVGALAMGLASFLAWSPRCGSHPRTDLRGNVIGAVLFSSLAVTLIISRILLGFGLHI